jgi:hypothetical protein
MGAVRMWRNTVTYGVSRQVIVFLELVYLDDQGTEVRHQLLAHKCHRLQGLVFAVVYQLQL